MMVRIQTDRRLSAYIGDIVYENNEIDFPVGFAGREVWATLFERYLG